MLREAHRRPSFAEAAPRPARRRGRAGAWVCLAESRGYSREQLVRGYTWGPDFYARMFLGYLVYDLASMLIHFRELGDPTAIVHHVIFALMAAYVLAHSIMAFPFVWLAFCEVSTPSVNLRCGPRPAAPPGPLPANASNSNMHLWRACQRAALVQSPTCCAYVRPLARCHLCHACARLLLQVAPSSDRAQGRQAVPVQRRAAHAALLSLARRAVRRRAAAPGHPPARPPGPLRSSLAPACEDVLPITLLCISSISLHKHSPITPCLGLQGRVGRPEGQPK